MLWRIGNEMKQALFNYNLQMTLMGYWVTLTVRLKLWEMDTSIWLDWIGSIKGGAMVLISTLYGSIGSEWVGHKHSRLQQLNSVWCSWLFQCSKWLDENWISHTYEVRKWCWVSTTYHGRGWDWKTQVGPPRVWNFKSMQWCFTLQYGTHKLNGFKEEKSSHWIQRSCTFGSVQTQA